MDVVEAGDRRGRARERRGVRPGFRLARAAVFAAMCVTVSGLGHVMMSGAGVPAWALGYAFAGVTAAAWWLTGRERGAFAVTASTVVAQAALHCLFTVGQMLPAAGGGYAAGATPGMRGMPGMAMGPAGLRGLGGPGGLGGFGVPGGSGGPASSSVVGGLGGLGGPGGLGGLGGLGGGHAMHAWTPGMLAAHLAAALLCALWLWRGEAAAWRIGRALAALVTGPLSRARAAGAASPLRASVAGRPPTPGATRRPAAVLLRYALVRRGPPRVVRGTADLRP